MKEREVSRTENRVVRRKVHQQPLTSEPTAQDAYPSSGMMAAAAALYSRRVFEQEPQALDRVADEMPISMTVLMGPDGEEDAPLDVDIMH